MTNSTKTLLAPRLFRQHAAKLRFESLESRALVLFFIGANSASTIAYRQAGAAMGFRRLGLGDIEQFSTQPEVYMDIQIGFDSEGVYAVVIGGRIALKIDEELNSQMQMYQEFNQPRPGRSFEDHAEMMERWTNSLPSVTEIIPVPLDEALDAMGFIHLGPIGRLPPTPYRPRFVYGHLPFHGYCSGSEVFYRYESYPTSVRIDLALSGVIKSDTFASPTNELSFVPSGLAAVARYALPSLLPARWRYELRPPAGTHIKYGACVPMYGQSGGGVEIMFTTTFKNIGPIANPVVLPVF